MHLLAFLLTALSFVPHVLAALVGLNTSEHDSLGARGYEVITNRFRTTWPVLPGQGGRNVVRYCYVDALSKGRLQSNLERAMQVWINALGGPASAATGHNLVFAEIQGQQGQQKFCCTSYTRLPGSQYRYVWDPEVQHDVLAIHWLNSRDQSTTLGYLPASNPIDDVHNRHHMHLSDIAPPHIYKIVHELGHVLGLDHEFQRPDRDQYLIYRCEKVRDFWPSLNRALDDPANQFIQDWEIRYKLCNEILFAVRYDFAGAAFIDNAGTQSRYNSHPFGAFDAQSVMMYDSTAGVDDALTSMYDPTKCPQNPAECAMVKRGNGPNGEPGVSLTRNFIPSAGDLDFVRAFYPWA
ncbi:uncharacterized protein N0V89_000522 [Didymosphaeria variabile]|uniref:Peptidase metallopeptidase domain-containing protein n=1 Tax=Didymosphaeria variabile TaxID=1932322 RepID=A0A9W8XVB2_9PLEO|nr:uncharacterized protein N0V89_000522 [Didymosphaeria variabile]KAJ4359963.1 hypothetical protein N0V89_000522 [Didymosphaeria variabile]